VFFDILSYTIGNIIFCIFKKFELNLIIITARVYNLRLAEVNVISCFQSTYTKCNSVINKDYPYPLPHLNSIIKPVINVSDVLQSLDTVKLLFSPAPDRIPSCILMNCSFYFALPLTLIFNLSLSQSRFPYIWRESFIVPIV